MKMERVILGGTEILPRAANGFVTRAKWRAPYHEAS
jgi:hypothetical protein